MAPNIRYQIFHFQNDLDTPYHVIDFVEKETLSRKSTMEEAMVIMINLEVFDEDKPTPYANGERLIV